MDLINQKYHKLNECGKNEYVRIDYYMACQKPYPRCLQIKKIFVREFPFLVEV